MPTNSSPFILQAPPAPAAATMSSPPATKKRKLDNLSADTLGKSDASILLDDDDDISPAQRLPPPLWGSIMDFMHYSDVRSTIAVCRSIATEAAANVKCISVHHFEEMKIPPARRFTHVEEVNLLSVIVHGERQRISFSAAAASQIVPFLTAFPMLKKFFVGGRRRDQALLRLPRGCSVLQGLPRLLNSRRQVPEGARGCPPQLQARPHSRHVCHRCC